MAKINVSNLHPVGFDLFSDSENYMSELSEREFDSINGGGVTLTTTSPAVAAVVQSSQGCARGAAKGAAAVAGTVAVATAGWMETG